MNCDVWIAVQYQMRPGITPHPNNANSTNHSNIPLSIHGPLTTPS